MGGDKHHRGRTVRCHLTDVHAEIEATLSRHLDIEKDEVEMILLQQALCGERIIQAYGGKVGLSERGTDRLARNDFVVHYQNPRRHQYFGLRVRGLVEQGGQCVYGLRDRPNDRRRDLLRLGVQFDEQRFQSIGHLRDFPETKKAGGASQRTNLPVHFGEFSPAQIFLFRPGEDLMTGPQLRECFRRVNQKGRDSSWLTLRLRLGRGFR